MAPKESVELKELQVSFLGITGKWVADRRQMDASWEMYVELVTRISVQPLAPDEGLLREALSSLYALFGETRRILKHYGPGIARPLKRGSLTFGGIAVDVLNKVLRPVLAHWHPLLQAYEHTRPPQSSPLEHEQAWSENTALRKALDEVRGKLTSYADLLARAASIEPMH